MLIRARGSAAIRATHAKTFELTAEPDVGPRATCVIGVGAALPGVSLAGPLSITVEAGGERDEVQAVANPFHVPGSRAVVRRSDQAPPDTLAGLADKGAADLSRALARALADPSADVLVTVTETAPAGVLAVVRAASATRPAGRVVEDDGRVPPGVAGEVARGGRVVLLVGESGVSEAGAALVRAATASGAFVVTPPGESPVPDVLLLSGMPTGSYAVAGRGSLRNYARVDAPVVLRVPVHSLGKAISQVENDLPQRVVCYGRTPVSPYRPAVGTAGERGEVLVVAGPPDAVPLGDLDELLAALLAEGVSTRTLADGMARLPGWTRRKAYAHLLALT